MSRQINQVRLALPTGRALSGVLELLRQSGVGLVFEEGEHRPRQGFLKGVSEIGHEKGLSAQNTQPVTHRTAGHEKSEAPDAGASDDEVARMISGRAAA